MEESTQKDFQVSQGIIDMLSYEPSLPEIPISKEESVLFAEKPLRAQPASFEANRRDMLYRASDDKETGDRIVISGKEFLMSAGFLGSFCDINEFQSPRWFMTEFNEIQRNENANQLLANRGAQNFKIFYENTDRGTVLLNVVPDRFPVMSDINVLKLIEDEFGTDAVINHFQQSDKAMFVRFLTGYEEDVSPKDKKLGDIMGFGAELSNSQLGWQAPRISVFTERLSCLNGATRKAGFEAWSFKSKKSSESIMDLEMWYRQSLRKMVKEYANLAEKMRKNYVKPAGEFFLSDLIAHYHLNEKVVDAIESAYKAEPPSDGEYPTVWHYANAITRAAHEGEFTFKIQRKLETIGGELIMA